MKKNLRNCSEYELVTLLKEGSEPALKELFLRFEQKILLYVFRLTRSHEVAEEILQDTFIKLWEYRENLDVTLSFSAFVYKIAKNRILNYLRANTTRVALKKEYSLSMVTSGNATEEQIFFDEYVRIADRAIDCLPPQRKSIFKMSRNEGKSYEEIAVALGISKNTVRLQIVQSLKDIRRFMSMHSDIADSFFTVWGMFWIYFFSA
ncbi:RNA polymerase sigma-70 factor [Chryseolinea lacunae]|uniref:RNA polymerase sigma-70 factor n=1 Tax=Chryseolinea lacunae TaxID=2801331 RepID=A0ABS1L2C5_9BACT|nr:RNA polymerase sigma-70 factor [Chryseolinea lacunae]MBL0745603.1 RNA polymerase sigma-70 factor [Chryseolinea lacunae]